MHWTHARVEKKKKTNKHGWHTYLSYYKLKKNQVIKNRRANLSFCDIYII